MVPLRVLLLGCWVGSAAPAMPPVAGYTHIPNAVIGDAAMGEPGNLDPPDQLTSIEPAPCSGEACIKAAAAACDANDECVSFAVACDGGDPTKAARAQLFRAGIGNVVGGGSWQLYTKPKPCGSCAGGATGSSAPAKNLAMNGAKPDVDLPPHQHSQCVAKGNAYPCGHAGPPPECTPPLVPNSVVIYCEESTWGWTVVSLVVVCGGLYVAGGVGLATRRSGERPSLAAHPHHDRWLELGALVTDGVQMAQARLQGRQGYAPLARAGAAQATKGGRGAGGAGKREKKERKGKKKRRDKDEDERTEAEMGAEPRRVEQPEPAAGSEQPQSAAQPAAAGTAAGDGGRWVRLPE